MTNSETVDVVSTTESFSVHWRAVFAGFFLSGLVYMILTSIGVAIGAGQAQEVLQSSGTAEAVARGLGIWMLASILVSLFVGCYAASRASGLIATRVGYIQGAVITSLFLSAMIIEGGALLSSSLGSIKNAVAGVSQNLMDSPAVTNAIEDALGDTELKSPPNVVVSGVISRMVNSDSQSVVDYLSAQTGMSEEEAAARYQDMKARVTTTANDLGQKAADLTRKTAWFASVLMLLGTVFGMFGGALGAQMNMRKPVDSLDRNALNSARQTPAYT
jgi:hypothetical protein